MRCAFVRVGIASLVMLMACGMSWAEGEVDKAEKAVAESATGNTAFALDLYAKLREAEGNVFVSPLSISTALGMTYAGAEGETAKQMSQVLHLPEDKAKAAAQLGALLKTLDALGKQKGCELNIANSLWGQKGYPFRPEFLAGIKEHYEGGFEPIDFGADPDAARGTINAWVEKKTKDRIKELLLEGDVTALTRLVLVNAIYFKGDWKFPFKEERTKDAPWQGAVEKEMPTIPMMTQTRDFAYAETDEFQALELPYAGDAASMVVFLPRKEDGLDAFEKSLTVESLDKWLKSLRSREVEVYLPRFTMTIRYDMSDTLIAMGMPLAFSPKADFSGMTTEERLWISKVIHKAFVDVNEKGTEAAAATAVIMEGEAMPEPPPVFRADHPFFFLIRNTKTGSILFMGRVTNPKG